jgi:hypothetical protein
MEEDNFDDNWLTDISKTGKYSKYHILLSIVRICV